MKPIVKWAGGKGKLLSVLHPLLPAKFDRYVEPFFGGGAMGFSINEERFSGPRIYGDANADLMLFYDSIVDRASAVACNACTFSARHTAKRYLEVRALYNAMAPYREDSANMTGAMRELHAAMFIYLNKTGFNGLYRVNDKGLFNVSPNPDSTWNPTATELCVQLIPASSHLRKASLFTGGFHALFATCPPKAGDFFFCDPPYVPAEESPGFTSYTKEDFTPFDLASLAVELEKASDTGAFFMLTHRATPLARVLFDKFHVTEVSAARTISCKGSTRLPVTELIIRNYQ